jgi:hypothetical protein
MAEEASYPVLHAKAEEKSLSEALDAYCIDRRAILERCIKRTLDPTIDNTTEVEQLSKEFQRLARARAARQQALEDTRVLEADPPCGSGASSPDEPAAQPSVQMFTVTTTEKDVCETYCRVIIANKLKYLERAMGYASEGLLWAAVASAPPRKLAAGGTEYTLRFPRPAYFDENLPWTRDGKGLPSGHYDGTITLTLSNSDWAPYCGHDTPAFTSRLRSPAPCTVTLVLESLRPIKMPAQESGLALTWAQLKASLRDAFLPNGGDIFFLS